MKRIGLTGGIGMGKSTAAVFLRDLGIPVADTDRIARELVAPGQPALTDIRACFGDTVFDSGGRLDRQALGDLIFGSAVKRNELESILHPKIRAAWQLELAAWETAGEPLGAVEIPLLFETGAENLFSAVICVACSGSSQFERLEARGWTDRQMRSRIAAQWPIERKMERADFVVWTEGEREVQKEQLSRVVRCVMAGAGG